MPRLKIAVVAPYAFIPYRSGGQKFIYKFLEYLGKEADITVYSTTSNQESGQLSYTLQKISKQKFSRYINPVLAGTLLKEIRKQKFDCIIWEHPYYAWLAWYIKKRTGIKTIIHTHNIEYLRFKTIGKWWWPILKIYERWFFRFADEVLFISEEDKSQATGEWAIPESKCLIVPYGTDLEQTPPDRSECRNKILAKYKLPGNTILLFFNGQLNYTPNLDAVKYILYKMNPVFMQEPGFSYRIIISGQQLPGYMKNLDDFRDKNIIYTGFVEDIDLYYKASDILLNPVESGGGVKTKVIEAISNGTTVISTQTGAIGIDPAVCGSKLIIINSLELTSLPRMIAQQSQNALPVPGEFYRKYNWKNCITSFLFNVAKS